MSENIRPYVMHEAGSIPGVPGPNHGLWPGGITVNVDMNTMEVVSMHLIGGGVYTLPTFEAEQATLEAPAQEQAKPVQEAGQEVSN